MKTIRGTNGPDRLVGDGAAEFILGLDGSDTIRGGKSASFSEFFGGKSDDVIYTGARNDVLAVGGSGGDEFHLGMGRVSVYAGRGADNVLVGTGDEFLIGGAGQDTLSGLGAKSSYAINTDEDGYTHLIKGGVEIVEKGFETLAFAPEAPAAPPAPVPTPTPVPVPVPTPNPPAGGGGGSAPPPPPVPTSTTTPSGSAGAGHTNATGGFFFGDGTTPADKNVTTVTSNEAQNPGVAFAVIPRQELHDDTFAPTTTTTAGNVTSLTYDLPAGSESTANDSQANNANREATNFIFGFEAGDLAKAIAAGDNFELGITTNTGSTFTGHLVADPNTAGHFIVMGDGASAGGNITDNGGNAGNSFNAEQGIFFGGHIPANGDMAQVNVDVTNSAGTELAGIHSTLKYHALAM